MQKQKYLQNYQLQNCQPMQQYQGQYQFVSEIFQIDRSGTIRQNQFIKNIENLQIIKKGQIRKVVFGQLQQEQRSIYQIISPYLAKTGQIIYNTGAYIYQVAKNGLSWIYNKVSNGVPVVVQEIPKYYFLVKGKMQKKDKENKKQQQQDQFQNFQFEKKQNQKCLILVAVDENTDQQYIERLKQILKQNKSQYFNLQDYQGDSQIDQIETYCIQSQAAFDLANKLKNQRKEKKQIQLQQQNKQNKSIQLKEKVEKNQQLTNVLIQKQKTQVKEIELITQNQQIKEKINKNQIKQIKQEIKKQQKQEKIQYPQISQTQNKKGPAKMMAFYGQDPQMIKKIRQHERTLAGYLVKQSKLKVSKKQQVKESKNNNDQNDHQSAEYFEALKTQKNKKHIQGPLVKVQIPKKNSQQLIKQTNTGKQFLLN